MPIDEVRKERLDWLKTLADEYFEVGGGTMIGRVLLLLLMFLMLLLLLRWFVLLLLVTSFLSFRMFSGL